MKQLVRVQNFGVSSDGFGAGEGQSLERPFGHANPGELLSWAFATAHFANRTEAGGTYGLAAWDPPRGGRTQLRVLPDRHQCHPGSGRADSFLPSFGT